MKEQTNGERFEEFMRTVEGYPELEGTMNLCEDIIEKRTGKMTEEEWQAAERAQTEPKDVVLGYKTSLDAQMLDSQLPKQENCCTPIGQIKRYVDCIGCDRKPNQETIEEVALKYLKSKGVKMYPEEVHLFTAGAKWQEERMYSEEEVRLMLSESFKSYQKGYYINPDDIKKKFKKY